MRGVYRTAICSLLAACATRQAVPNVDTQPASGFRAPEVILRNTSWEDPELAAKGLGRLEFAIRSADRPAQKVSEALVLVKLSGTQNPWKQVMTDEQGIARFDSIAVGRYELRVRRIGYGPANSEAIVSPGCRTDVEVYIGISAMGIAPPPPEPGRVRVTTCRVGR